MTSYGQFQLNYAAPGHVMSSMRRAGLDKPKLDLKAFTPQSLINYASKNNVGYNDAVAASVEALDALKLDWSTATAKSRAMFPSHPLHTGIRHPDKATSDYIVPHSSYEMTNTYRHPL